MLIDERMKEKKANMIDQREISAEHSQTGSRVTLPESYRPIIGIPVPVQQGERGLLLQADAFGARAVEHMQGRVFLIPLWPFPTHKYVYQSLWSLIQAMDGLLLPASVEETHWYEHWRMRERHPGLRTWPIAWEIALVQLATVLGMPLLAIAEGAEKWNIALGGLLREQTEPPLTSPDTWPRSMIRVRAQSKLALSMQHSLAEQGEPEGQPAWTLPLLSTQRMTRLAPGLRSCALAEKNGLVAFERRDPSFGLGILARIDWGLDQEYSQVLFKAFLQACRSFALARQQHNVWEASRDTICRTVYERVASRRPLLPTSSVEQEEALPRSEQLSDIHTLVPPSLRMGRLRSHTPTREDLNRIRRQRLKVSSR